MQSALEDAESISKIITNQSRKPGLENLDRASAIGIITGVHRWRFQLCYQLPSYSLCLLAHEGMAICNIAKQEPAKDENTTSPGNLTRILKPGSLLHAFYVWAESVAPVDEA